MITCRGRGDGDGDGINAIEGVDLSAMAYEAVGDIYVLCYLRVSMRSCPAKSKGVQNARNSKMGGDL